MFEPLNPQLILACRPPPEAHRPALDLRGRGDLDELIEATGRPYRTYNYYAPTESPPFDVSEPLLAAAAPRLLECALRTMAPLQQLLFHWKVSCGACTAPSSTTRPPSPRPLT